MATLLGPTPTTRAVSKIFFLKSKFIYPQHYSLHIKWLFEVLGPQICQQGMLNSNNLPNFVINYDKTLKISIYPHISTYPHHNMGARSGRIPSHMGSNAGRTFLPLISFIFQVN